MSRYLMSLVARGAGLASAGTSPGVVGNGAHREPRADETATGLVETFVEMDPAREVQFAATRRKEAPPPSPGSEAAALPIAAASPTPAGPSWSASPTSVASVDNHEQPVPQPHAPPSKAAPTPLVSAPEPRSSANVAPPATRARAHLDTPSPREPSPAPLAQPKNQREAAALSTALLVSPALPQRNDAPPAIATPRPLRPVTPAELAPPPHAVSRDQAREDRMRMTALVERLEALLERLEAQQRPATRLPELQMPSAARSARAESGGFGDLAAARRHADRSWYWR
jgi:hypothetical protein